MRMWKVPPEYLCDQHLLGEHLEMHMFAGTIKQGYSIEGYIRGGLVETGLIKERHDALVREMKHRYMNHKSPLEQPKTEPRGKINVEENVRILCRRCKVCRTKLGKLCEKFKN